MSIFGGEEAVVTAGIIVVTPTYRLKPAIGDPQIEPGSVLRPGASPGPDHVAHAAFVVISPFVGRGPVPDPAPALHLAGVARLVLLVEVEVPLCHELDRFAHHVVERHLR
jgi:hypothetical protein